MELMTEEIKGTLPKLKETDGKDPEEIKIPLKFFHPVGAATWFVLEFDGDDTFFGYVVGLGCNELGHFSLSELQEVEGPLGLGIERDLYWDTDTTLAQIFEKHPYGH